MSNREEKRWQYYEAEKVTRTARKEIKRNRKPDKPARSKVRVPNHFDDWDEVDELSSPRSERVMPRGERERRRAVWTVLLAEAEKRLEEDALPLTKLPEEESPRACSPEQALPEHGMIRLRGVVTEVSSSLCQVDVGGRSLRCALRGSLSAEDMGFTNVVAVGDNVIVLDGNGQTDGFGQGVVEEVLPRRSVLARPDVRLSHLQQVLVANADQVLIVASWRQPHIWLELIDRYLITAERYKLSPIICVNKVDLAGQSQAEAEAICRATLQPYLDLNYRLLFTSAMTGQGISELRHALHDLTTVLAGLSGVGKSSLLMAVQPGLQLRVGEVSDWRGDGQHTTTQINMLKLEAGGFVVDTPGIREFGLSGLRRVDLARFYPEIEAQATHCRFGDCAHIHEPACAVKMAVQQGRVSKARYYNYKKLYHTLPA